MRYPFELDPQIIHHIIHSQAGSIGKALIELIMNSVDAGANNIFLEVNHNGFSIRDDGKGFSSKDEIMRYFGRFGTPHVDGDAKFGRFRLGRGQIMAHASTEWLTHRWKMTVDTKRDGYNYDLNEIGDSQPGCAIAGTWYERLDEREYLTTVQELRDLVRYTPAAVHLNGKLITRQPAAEKWDHEDEFAFYRLQRDGAMAIYNQGVLVRHDPGHFWGVGGVVVTKQAIALNVSRTEILRKTCPVWIHVAKQLKSRAAAYVEKDDPRRKTENSRGLAAKLLIAGGTDSLEAFEREEVITLLPGARHITFRHFLYSAGKGKGIAIVPGGADIAKAELIASSGVVTLVHPKTIERFGCYDAVELEEVLQIIRSQVATQRGYTAGKLSFVSYEAIETTFVERMEVLKDEVLADKDLRRAWRSLRWALRQYAELIRGGELCYNGVCRRRSSKDGYWRRQEQIAVLLGSSNVAEAWTDGATYIAINVEQVRRLSKDGLAAASHIFSLVEHEMAHEGDSIEAVHDEAFYSRFHDISTTFAARREWYIHKWLIKYLRSAEEEDARRKEPGWARRHLDLIERTSSVRRKSGNVGLLDDILQSPDLGEEIPKNDEVLLGFVNSLLVERGANPQPAEWADIVRLSEEYRRRAKEKNEALRAEQAAEEAEINAAIEAYERELADTVQKVEVALGLNPGAISSHHADAFVGKDEPMWAAIWQRCLEDDAEALQEAEREAAQINEGRGLMAKATGRDPASISDSEAMNFFYYGDDFLIEIEFGPEDDFDPYLAENPEIAEDFVRMNGRKAEGTDELIDWDNADRPSLTSGETMTTLNRNAAIVGLPLKEYLSWRNSTGNS